MCVGNSHARGAPRLDPAVVHKLGAVGLGSSGRKPNRTGIPRQAFGVPMGRAYYPSSYNRPTRQHMSAI